MRKKNESEKSQQKGADASGSSSTGVRLRSHSGRRQCGKRDRPNVELETSEEDRKRRRYEGEQAVDKSDQAVDKETQRGRQERPGAELDTSDGDSKRRRCESEQEKTIEENQEIERKYQLIERQIYLTRLEMYRYTLPTTTEVYEAYVKALYKGKPSERNRIERQGHAFNVIMDLIKKNLQEAYTLGKIYRRQNLQEKGASASE